MKVDPVVREHATDAQRRFLDAVAKHGSARAAAKALGVNHTSVLRSIKRAIASAARHGHAPNHDLEHPAAPGFRLGFVTTHYDGQGNVTQQWVRQKPERERELALLREAVEDVVAAGKGRLAPLKPPKDVDEELLAVYPLADAHIGLLAWAKETGENFDLDIAEASMADTVDRLVASAPKAKKALLINLGDYFHADSADNKTTRGTPQDVDGRYGKVALAGVRIKRRIVDRLLQHHQEVEVWTIAGNHDNNTAIWLAIAMASLYERDPRVNVVVDPAPYQVTDHGSTLLAAAHGNTASIDRLPAFLAANWPEKWGSAEHRIWYTGHLHHDSVKEHPGCIVETLRTTAGRDAWTHASAYHNGRDLKCDVWHREHGRIARLIQKVA